MLALMNTRIARFRPCCRAVFGGAKGGRGRDKAPLCLAVTRFIKAGRTRGWDRVSFEAGVEGAAPQSVAKVWLHFRL